MTLAATSYPLADGVLRREPADIYHARRGDFLPRPLVRLAIPTLQHGDRSSLRASSARDLAAVRARVHDLRAPRTLLLRA